MSDIIQRKLLQQSNVTTTAKSSKWIGKPRRGQYRVFRSTPKTHIIHPIQPIPTQFSKGIFVFSTLYDQIIVGPTAQDQQSRTDRSIDPNVSQELATIAKRIIPNLDIEKDYIGDYVGIRPGTDQRDYQIHLQPNINLCTASGIRSTGLTASLGISRHVVHLLKSILSESTKSNKKKKKIQTTPLPSVSELVQDYHRRGDGYVTIHQRTYKVTHPITKFGWDAAAQSGSIVVASTANLDLKKTDFRQGVIMSKL